MVVSGEDQINPIVSCFKAILTILRPMKFCIKFDTVKAGCSIE